MSEGRGLADISRTDLMLLGLLLQRAMHGYDIAETLGGPKMDLWVRLGRTSIYYALGRLERDGLVSKHAERRGGKPERTVYSITDEGRRSFFGALKGALSEPTEAMDEFDIALYYSNQLEPELAGERVGERLATLTDDGCRIAEAVVRATAEDDLPLTLVLEHRLAILEANAEFLKRFLEMLAGRRPEAAGLTGDLAVTMLHDVLRNLAAAGRTGILTVTPRGHEVAFALADGRLYGVLPHAEWGLEVSLREAFTSTSGTYEFAPGTDWVQGASEVRGLNEAILLGCRGVTERAAALERMLPDPDTLLETAEGYEYDVIGVDLTDDERTLLAESDGVRSPIELARHLGWPEGRVASATFPLWALGWIVRADRDKRLLVLATASYARRWSDAVELFAGKKAADTVTRDARTAAEVAGITDFMVAAAAIAATRFTADRNALGAQAREYASITRRAVAARLGEDFASDVAAGFVARIPEPEAALLKRYGLVPEA